MAYKQAVVRPILQICLCLCTSLRQVRSRHLHDIVDAFDLWVICWVGARLVHGNDRLSFSLGGEHMSTEAYYLIIGAYCRHTAVHWPKKPT